MSILYAGVGIAVISWSRRTSGLRVYLAGAALGLLLCAADSTDGATSGHFLAMFSLSYSAAAVVGLLSFAVSAAARPRLLFFAVLPVLYLNVALLAALLPTLHLLPLSVLVWGAAKSLTPIAEPAGGQAERPR